jgi:hypothetical protein
MSLPTVVVHLVGTQLVEMTRQTEMVEGEVRGMTVIMTGMQFAATEIMVEIGTETVTEKAGVIDEARVENDTESLRLGEMIHLLCRQGEVGEEGKMGPMYLRLPLPHHRHRQCMGRMRDGDQDLELHKDHVEEAIVGVTMAEKAQVAAVVVVVEIEMMTYRQESIHVAKKVLHMAVVEAEGEARGWQARARGLEEEHENSRGLVGHFFSTAVYYSSRIRICWNCIAPLAFSQGVWGNLMELHHTMVDRPF